MNLSLVRRPTHSTWTIVSNCDRYVYFEWVLHCKKLSLEQLHLLLYRLQVELVQVALLLDVLLHREVHLFQQIFHICRFFVQILDVFFNVLEVFGIGNAGACYLGELFGAHMPDTLMLAFHFGSGILKQSYFGFTLGWFFLLGFNVFSWILFVFLL